MFKLLTSSKGWDGQPSDHFDGTRFFNRVKTQKSWADFRKWQRERVPAKWQKRDNNPYPLPPERVGEGELLITVIGHATVLVQADGMNWLTDPLWSQYASPVQFAGPKRYRAPAIAIQDLPPIDGVLLSHNHYDHLDAPTLKKLAKRDNPLIVTGLGNRQTLVDCGCTRVVELDWWQSHTLPNGQQVIATPAQHWSKRTLKDTNRSLWVGLSLSTPSGAIFFAGDTGYGEHFAEIHTKLGAPRCSLLPIGAYKPRWFLQNMHMNPDDAVRAHQDLKSRHSVSIHFGTFQLTDEGMDEPVVDLATAQLEHQVTAQDFIVPDFGQTYAVP